MNKIFILTTPSTGYYGSHRPHLKNGRKKTPAYREQVMYRLNANLDNIHNIDIDFDQIERVIDAALGQNAFYYAGRNNTQLAPHWADVGGTRNFTELNSHLPAPDITLWYESEQESIKGEYLGVKRITFDQPTELSQLLCKTHFDQCTNLYCNDQFKSIVEQYNLGGLNFDELNQRSVLITEIEF